MNAWHVYARYYNIGDHALGVGVRNIFARWFSDRLLFKSYNTVDLVFDRGIVRELNRTADLLLVGGGGLIHEFGGSWLFKMPDPVIPLLDVPAIFFGLGYNPFRGEKGVSPQVITNLKLLQRKAVSFSVRNDGSRERLAAVGFDAPEVPDPGFFVDGDYDAPPVRKPYVCVQLANDAKSLRGFQDDLILPGLAQGVRNLLRRGYSVVLTPHVRADIALSQALIEHLETPPDVHMWNWFDMLREEHTIKALAYYKHADFVLGMRGHAQICPIGMGTPVVTIANHDKHVGLIGKLGIDPLLVEVSDPHLGDRLVELSTEAENRRVLLAAQCRGIMEKLTGQMEMFVLDLRKKFESHPKRQAAPPTLAARAAGKIRNAIHELTS